MSYTRRANETPHLTTYSENTTPAQLKQELRVWDSGFRVYARAKLLAEFPAAYTAATRSLHIKVCLHHQAHQTLPTSLSLLAHEDPPESLSHCRWRSISRTSSALCTSQFFSRSFTRRSIVSECDACPAEWLASGKRPGIEPSSDFAVRSWYSVLKHKRESLDKR
ncbi:hypothetical protein KC19_10G113300 [Ceratodon purpureus]|uniref:Uncharacterized protein n=1 Tax=Ceratodon purpureus TaxID=3225 RepID=A0A8T0GJ44_CERPU|nr:hypothetical protein KC19_10G113300 [Ceratodon purpureus]